MNKSVAPWVGRIAGIACIAMLAGGCTVGPNYKKPVANVPPTYHGLDAGRGDRTAASAGDQKWFDVYQDQQLRSLIRTAIQQNYDLRIAGSRILAAQAQLGVTRSDQYPQVAGRRRLARGAKRSYSTDSSFRKWRRAIEPRSRLGTRFLGEISPGHRSGARQSGRHRVGTPGSHRHTGGQRLGCVFSASRFGSRTRDLATHVGLTSGIAAAHTHACRWGLHIDARCAPGRTVGFHGRR